MITSELVSMLRCPTCTTGDLHPSVDVLDDVPIEQGELSCSTCGVTYPIRLGFPMLMPEAALNGPEWRLWREHLEKLQARRQARVINPHETINRLALRSRPKPPFAAFTRITKGRVLDVGCGTGQFGTYFDPGQVRYVGLDPIVLPDMCDFPFVRGLAEHIPFKDDTFTDVVVLAALDHFRDVDRFFSEAGRILEHGGRLHSLQSVHEVRGPLSAVRVVAHKVKDSWEDRNTTARGSRVPKHLSEFTSGSLLSRLRGTFELVASESHSATWYSPLKLFLSLTPKNGVGAPVGSAT
jgi:SAM-dependent methyltransferase